MELLVIASTRDEFQYHINYKSIYTLIRPIKPRICKIYNPISQLKNSSKYCAVSRDITHLQEWRWNQQFFSLCPWWPYPVLFSETFQNLCAPWIQEMVHSPIRHHYKNWGAQMEASKHHVFAVHNCTSAREGENDWPAVLAFSCLAINHSGLNHVRLRKMYQVLAFFLRLHEIGHQTVYSVENSHVPPKNRCPKRKLPFQWDQSRNSIGWRWTEQKDIT